MQVRFHREVKRSGAASIVPLRVLVGTNAKLSGERRRGSLADRCTMNLCAAQTGCFAVARDLAPHQLTHGC